MAGGFVRNLYRAVRGSETIFGTDRDLGAALGMSAKSIPKVARRLSNTAQNGWTITRVLYSDVPPGFRNKAEQNFIATKDSEDPIMGTAEEIAALIGASENGVERAGRASKSIKGWHVSKASEEEVAKFERQWL